MRALAVAASLLLLLGACGDDGLGPGESIGPILLGRGAAEDVSLWDFCDPELPEPGAFERACPVPPLDRLRIGPGWRAASASELDSEWDELEWRVSLDGRALALEEFGTLPDTALADGRSVREWNVIAEGLSGEHRLRALITRGDRTYDVTWSIRVGGSP
jgi:hypothetical protein